MDHRLVVGCTLSDGRGVDDFALEEGGKKEGGGTDNFFMQQSTITLAAAG